MSVTMDDSYTSLDETVMSNCDYTIENDVADKLKTGKFYSQYAGWNFCGYVYWNKDKWYCEIWTYHSHVKTVHRNTLDEIMDKVSEEYGND